MTPFLSQNAPYTLLYFYPKDNTPGCTLEAVDFTRLKETFLDMGVEIVGVSRDSEASHEKFSTKHQLGIRLIADANEVLHHAFDVIGEKKNYGKVSVGVIRSTFLLDSHTGEVLKEWRNVKATGHAERVLKEIQEFLKNSLSVLS